MTRREQIIEILAKEEKSAQQLANDFNTEMFDILEDLKHIKCSIKPKKLLQKPAECKKCGFNFGQNNNIDILVEDLCTGSGQPHAGGMSELRLILI